MTIALPFWILWTLTPLPLIFGLIWGSRVKSAGWLDFTSPLESMLKIGLGFIGSLLAVIAVLVVRGCGS